MIRVLVIAAIAWCLSVAAQAQDGDGGPGQPKLDRTTTIRVTERHGIERTNWPVEVTIRFAREQVARPSDISLHRIQDLERIPVRFQVLDWSPHNVVGPFNAKPQTFVRLVFFVTLEAKQTHEFAITIRGNQAPRGAGLQVNGVKLGKTIDCGPVVWELDDRSGQLRSIQPKFLKLDPLEFVQGDKPPRPGEPGPQAIHPGPEILAPPNNMSSTRNWNLPLPFDPVAHQAARPPVGDNEVLPFYFREWTGPLVYRSARWGKMPFLPDVTSNVSYTFFYGQPYVRIRSTMEFTSNTQLLTVSGAKLQFSRGHFDELLTIDRNGKAETTQVFDQRRDNRFFLELAKERFSPDTPIVGFINTQTGVGVVLMDLGTVTLNKYAGRTTDDQAHYQAVDSNAFGAKANFNYLSLTRYFVAREGKNLPTAVAEGSMFVEDMALLCFKLGGPRERFDEILYWYKQLTNPLDVSVN